MAAGSRSTRSSAPAGANGTPSAHRSKLRELRADGQDDVGVEEQAVGRRERHAGGDHERVEQYAALPSNWFSCICSAGVDVPNAVAAPLAGDGSACVFSQERTDVVIDVNGYFATEGYAFAPVSPARLADTRTNGTRLAAGGTLRVPVAGLAGVPSTAVAAVLNVTATDAADAGFLTVFPCDQPLPSASNVNYGPGVDSPNAVAAALAADGSACIYSLRAVDVVVDVSGSFGLAGTIFNAVVPSRLADTRATANRVAAGTALRVQVTGQAGVPEGAAAAVLNVTATGAAAPGFLTVFPCDQPLPTASNVNYRPGVDVPNAVVAPLAADGSTCVYSLRGVDVVVDVNGFFE